MRKKVWLLFLLFLFVNLGTDARYKRSWKIGRILKDGSFERPINALRAFIGHHYMACKAYPKKIVNGSYSSSCPSYNESKSLLQVISQMTYFEIENNKYAVAFKSKPFADLLVLEKKKEGISLIFRSSRPKEILKFCSNNTLKFCKSNFIKSMK